MHFIVLAVANVAVTAALYWLVQCCLLKRLGLPGVYVPLFVLLITFFVNEGVMAFAVYKKHLTVRQFRIADFILFFLRLGVVMLIAISHFRG